MKKKIAVSTVLIAWVVFWGLSALHWYRIELSFEKSAEIHKNNSEENLYLRARQLVAESKFQKNSRLLICVLPGVIILIGSISRKIVQN